MKRKLLTLTTFLFPLLVFSQVTEDSTLVQVFEQEKDSMKFVSIADIIKEKEETTSRNDLIKHFDQVWSRRSFFNISYNSSTLVPKEDTPSGVGNATVQNCKSNIGISLQAGRSYRLHKKPIANILQFYIDYSGLDLIYNHYTIEGNGKNIYNSTQKYEVTNAKKGVTHSYYYIPWNLEKHEGSYGMSVGPSFTVAPFTHIPNRNGLHFLKFNMYFRIGYQVSILYMVNNEEADMNKVEDDDFERMSDNLKMNWGHGLLTNFGLSLTWKSIGIGYEHRVAHNKYKAITTEDFGKDSYKFKTSTDRVYISFRLGK